MSPLITYLGELPFTMDRVQSFNWTIQNSLFQRFLIKKVFFGEHILLMKFSIETRFHSVLSNQTIFSCSTVWSRFWFCKICWISVLYWRFETFIDSAKMEVFKLLKIHLAQLGFSQKQSMRPYPILNGKLLGASVAVIVNMVLCCVYFFFVASSFEEYIDSCFTSSGTTGIFVIFFVYVWKMKQLFQFIDLVYATVNASKYDLIVSTMLQQSLKFTRISAKKIREKMSKN